MDPPPVAISPSSNQAAAGSGTSLALKSTVAPAGAGKFTVLLVPVSAWVVPLAHTAVHGGVVAAHHQVQNVDRSLAERRWPAPSGRWRRA
jgi:hypothetical protein